MDGMHDLGGKQGFGKVMHSRDAVVFHADWEVRANALYSLAVKSGVFNMDEYRQRSLTSLATLCVEKGLVTHEELAQLAGGAYPLSMPVAAGRGNHANRTAFVPGDQVRVRDEHVAGHVRMPGYIRGKHGVVISQSPAYPFPDAHGHGIHADDEPTYDVRFEAAHLWPQGAEAAQVHVAVCES